jgi:glycogen operon protein
MPGVPEELRGTYAGLASEAAIDYLTDLGVTAIELLPIQYHVDERFW